MSRWDRLEELFAQAQPLAPAAREALLDEACAGDASLRCELDEMLAAATRERMLGIERLAPVDGVAPLVGSMIGRWRLVEPLGRGGMGTVYRAERADGEYQQRAALKMIAPGWWSPETADRFRTERQVLAQLWHPNIARLLDGGLADDGRPYLVMELVDGVPITESCATLALADRLRMFRVVCEAVQHAHGMLVVHRDLKPANTLVTAGGDVKLLDFGVAKLLEPAAFGVDVLPTRERPAPLTPEYAAPEQLFGGAITTATDVYSLGVLLHELLTGARPFRLEGKSLIECERELTSAAIERPSRRLRVARGDDIDSIVLTALRAQPERRYLSAGQLAEDIGRYLDGRPVQARADTLAYRTRRFVGRNRAAVSAGVAFALSVAGFAVVATWQAQHATEERDVAHHERDKAEKVAGLLVDLFETSNPTLRPEGDKLTIRQFLAEAEPRVLQRLHDEPALRARMRQVFGMIHAARDEPTEARTAFEQALLEQRMLLGADDPEAIESQYQLGMLRVHAGDEDGAAAIHREVLERCLRVYGENHVKTARVLLALGDERGPGEALALFERALAIERRVLPPNAPVIAETLGALGKYSKYSGDLRRARQLYEEALAIFRTPDERRNGTAITLLRELSALLVQTGELDEAVKRAREALELANSVNGPDSLQVARAMHDLALRLMTRGQYVEGERVFRATYERHLAVLGEHHWETINIARDLAWTLALRRDDQALTWIDRAVAAISRMPGDNASQLRQMEGQRSIILLHLGRDAEAIAAAKSTLAAASSQSVEPRVVVSLHLAFALVLLETGHAREAEPHARAALVDAKHMGATAYANCLLGWSLVATGHAAEARPLIAGALPLYRNFVTADPHLVAALDRALATTAPK